MPAEGAQNQVGTDYNCTTLEGQQRELLTKEKSVSRPKERKWNIDQLPAERVQSQVTLLIFMRNTEEPEESFDMIYIFSKNIMRTKQD